MPEPKSALNIVMGAMTFGEAGNEQSRVHDVKDVAAILDVFQAHGHTEVDTARVYGGGTSEEYLAKTGWKKRGLVMQTKLYPWPIHYRTNNASAPDHTAAGVHKGLEASLKALQTDKVDTFYLHGPDRSVPYEETLKAVDELHKEGKFDRFGISNYMSWEVAEIVLLCRANGWIQPTMYQGIYNAVQRAVEPELFPCLRKFDMSFYEFNPLGGGFFTGTYSRKDQEVEPGSRFDPSSRQGASYRQRYWNDLYFKALELVKDVADKHQLTMAEVALRWVSHHSSLKREYGDSVLIGASSLKHIEQNLGDLEKGPLPEEVVKVLDDAWKLVKPIAAPYYH